MFNLKSASKPTLIVVANATMARVFFWAGPQGALKPVTTVNDPDSHQGKVAQSHQHQDGAALSDDIGKRDKQANAYASELANLMRTEHQQKKFEELMLIVSPRFLGVLRHAMGKGLPGVTVHTLDKDWVHHDARGIQEALGAGA